MEQALDRAFPIRHNQINQGESAKSTATEISRLGKKQFTVRLRAFNSVASLHTASALCPTRVSSALEASSEPRKSASLLYR
jgi:hypothetical protein